MTATVDVMIACGPHQTNNWWDPVMGLLLKEQLTGIEIRKIRAISSALPDHNKNNTVTCDPWNEDDKRRASLTDANRVAAAMRFLDGDAEWLFSIDDDTVPPIGAISHLIGLGRPFVGGVYFNPKYPHNPIAYTRRDDGLYETVWDYAHGSLMEVDSIGMGCTLIHRSVFEKIRAEHTLFQRPNGSLFAVPNEAVITEDGCLVAVGGALVVTDGERFHFVQDITHLPNADDTRAWPFFALEYGRTEDHHFCELAANVGIKPYLDTAVTCEHWKPQPTSRIDYRKAELEIKEEGGEV